MYINIKYCVQQASFQYGYRFLFTNATGAAVFGLFTAKVHLDMFTYLRVHIL